MATRRVRCFRLVTCRSLRSWGKVLGVSFYKHFAPTGAIRIRPMRKAKAAHSSVVHRISTFLHVFNIANSLEGRGTWKKYPV